MVPRHYALYEACNNGNYEDVEARLQREDQATKVKLLEERFTLCQYTVLHAAVIAGHTRIVNLLLRNGASVNIVTTGAGNYTPLHVAATARQTECVRILLEQESTDISLKDDFGKTPYQTAAAFHDKEIAKLIKSAEVVRAAKDNNIKHLRALLLPDAKVNDFTEECFSSALLAASSDDRVDVEIFLCILSFVAQKTYFSTLDLMVYISLSFNQERFNVDAAALLILCWLASAKHENWQLGYFLGISDAWLQNQSRDGTLDILEESHHQRFTEVRELLIKKKCVDFAPAILIALESKHRRAAQMLLSHGAMSEKMYEVRWKGLGISSLGKHVIKDMNLRGSTGKISTWENITLLDLRRNNLETIPGKFFQLPLLSTLLLDKNRLKELPEVNWISESLNHLYLSDNQLKDLPNSISSSNLRTLYLNNNQFKCIPECIWKVSGLETLDVSGNQDLVWIPLQLGLLSKLTTFQFDNTKVVNPLGISKFSAANTKELVTWLRSLLSTMKPYTTIKLLVVGWQDKGKTTLVHRLKHDYKYNERKVTLGVEVTEVDIQHKLMSIIPVGPKVTFQVWDFAGQEDFYLMHMCFLSSVALYVLVWDLQDEERGIEELKTWLDNIACKALYRTTVIIVGTHLDRIKEKYSAGQTKDFTERMRDLVYKMVESRSSDKIHVADVVEISCHPSKYQGLDDLRYKIHKAARDIVKDKNVRVLDQPVPISFHTMVTKIEGMRNTMWKNKELPILTHYQLWSLVKETLGTKTKRFLEEEFNEAVEFLKDRGIILHFDDPNQDLRELYFIDPRWLFTLMARAITKQKDSNDGLVKKESLFSENEEETSFSEKSRERGILLLSRFHVVHILDKEHLLMPSRFAETKPKKIIHDEQHFVPLKRIYSMKYLPHGFFSRLIARLLHYMDSMIVEAFKGQEVAPLLPPLAQGQLAEQPSSLQPILPHQNLSSPSTPQHHNLQPSRAALPLPKSTPPWPSLPPPPNLPTTTPTTVRATLPPPQTTTTTATTTTTTTRIPATTVPTKPKPIIPGTPPPPKLTTTTTTKVPKTITTAPLITTAIITETIATPPKLTTTTTIPEGARIPTPFTATQSQPPSSTKLPQLLFSQPTTVTNLRNADILHWWRNGIQLNLPNVFLVVTLSNDAQNSPRIKIKTSPSALGRRLLVFTVEHIEALITEWFRGLRENKVSQFIPCIVCDRKGLKNPHVFTLEDCLKAGKSGCVECPRHRDISVLVSDIAPDISLHDVHPDLLFGHHELHYDEKSVIKEGSFGKVYRAILNKPKGLQKLVAIKEYKGDHVTSFRELRKEINVLRRIIHPNLIQMIGVSRQPRSMAFELAVYGSLDDMLFDKGADSQCFESIPRLVLIAIAKEVTNALAILHHHKIIHRDLKPSNVLIFSLQEEDSVHVKVSDFGTANFAGPWGLRAPVTRTHMRAPEVLEFALKEEYSFEVDIYSFAILLYAMISRERAFDDLSSSEIRPSILQHKRPPWRNVVGAMNKLVNLTRLMCVSWNQNPQDRPTAEQCRKQLGNPGFQSLMSKLAFPPENTVTFVHFVPCNDELWVLHRIDTCILLSVFTSNFSSCTKYCFEISANEDFEVESVCTHYDLMVVFLRKTSNYSGIFKIYSFTNSSLISSVNCDSLPAVNGLAVSDGHIFIATDMGCYTGNIDDHTNDSLATCLLTQPPVESILVSGSELWMSNNNSVMVFSILMDSQLEPLYDAKVIDITGVQQLYHSNETDNSIWALTEKFLFKMKGDGILSRFELQNLLNSHEMSLKFQGPVTCVLPAGDVLWLGLSTGFILIIEPETGQLITGFRAYSEPVARLVLSPDTHPPMVISCGRSPSQRLGIADDTAVFPLSIDNSEMVKVTPRKPSRVLTNINMNFEGNWDEVRRDGFRDVLLVWHAIPSESWKRIQRASGSDWKVKSTGQSDSLS